MGKDRGRSAGWARLAPLYWMDPKIGAAGQAGECAFLRGMSWSKYYGQDGAIDDSALTAIGAGLDRDYRDRCVDTGLWVPVDHGRIGIDTTRWARHQETEERRAEKADGSAQRSFNYRERQKADKEALQAEIDELRRKLNGD